jgi:hypothetical protein
VNGKVLIDNNDFSGITVTLSNDNSSKELPVSMAGMFYAGLDWNRKYNFTFRKKGYVTKIIEFSTFIPEGQSKRIEPYVLNVRLFRTFKGVDTVFFRKPVAKIYFDEKLNDFVDDRDYSLKVVYAIKQMRKRGTQPVSKNNTVTKADVPDKADVDIVQKIEHADTTKDIKKSGEGTAFLEHHSSGIPPLKKFYDKERTVEEFDLDRKHVTRVVIKKENYYKVYLRVEHSWGGIYYFIDESPLGYFSITESLFENCTGLDPRKMHHLTDLKK